VKNILAERWLLDDEIHCKSRFPCKSTLYILSIYMYTVSRHRHPLCAQRTWPHPTKRIINLTSSSKYLASKPHYAVNERVIWQSKSFL
jgi:hypothetical protein